MCISGNCSRCREEEQGRRDAFNRREQERRKQALSGAVGVIALLRQYLAVSGLERYTQISLRQIESEVLLAVSEAGAGEGT